MHYYSFWFRCWNDFSISIQGGGPPPSECWGGRRPPGVDSFHATPISVVLKTGMRSRDIFGQLRLRLRLRRSNPAPAPAPAPSKNALRLRLRAKCTGSGGSGSGSGSDDQVLIWALISNAIFKNVNCQNMTSYWLRREFECYFEWVSLKFVTRCHPRPLADIREVTDSFGLRCLRLVA